MRAPLPIGVSSAGKLGATGDTLVKGSEVPSDVEAVLSTDARLTDARVPTDGSVTNAKVATGAAIAWAKIASDVAVDPSPRVLRGRLQPNTVVPMTAGMAYFVYLGFTLKAITIKHVEFQTAADGTGAQTAEVGLFSTPSAPKKANQTLTKLVADGTLSSLTDATMKVARNTTAFGTTGHVVDAGVHLWAGLYLNMATDQPNVVGGTADLGGLGMGPDLGELLVKSAATAFTSGTTWVGSRGDGVSIQSWPDLIAVLD